MDSPLAPPSADSSLAFRLACWVLGLVAFAQLLTAGVALAARMEAARPVRVEERIVTKLVTMDSPRRPDPAPAPPVVPLPPPTYVAEAELPEARPLHAPPIADAVVERLVTEARSARVAEDMGRAITKLEEALERDPKEPNALYELGLVFETMAAYDTELAPKASEAYQKVFELGTSRAGALYPLAAAKLRDGIARPADMRGKLALGRVRIFNDDTFRGGEKVVLTVPVNAAPGQEPDADDFFVKIEFFEKTANGDPALIPNNYQVDHQFVSGAIDWLSGEELLRASCIIPGQGNEQARLFGQPSYYGQVVELYYRNELIDSQAWPRHLASYSQVESQRGYDPVFLEDEFDLGSGVLPPLDNELSLPPLPGER